MKALHAVAVQLSVCLLLSLPLHALAETVAALQTKLDQFKATLETKRSAFETVENRLASYEFKLQDAQKRMDSARQDLVDARAAVATAEADTSKDSQRLKDLASRRLELANHAIESQQARLDRVERKANELKGEADQLSGDIQWIEKQLTPLTEKIRSTIVAEKQAAQAEQEKLMRAMVQAKAEEEAAKLRAVQELKRLDEERAKQEAALKAQGEQENTPDDSNLVSDLVDTSSAPKLSTESGNQTVDTDSAQSDALTVTPRQKHARQEMARLNQRIAGADKTESRHFLELLMEIDLTRTVELEYLGNNQFYSEIALSAGTHKITISLRRFNVTVPSEADGDIFVVIYDASDKNDGRFVIFNKNLL